MRVYLVQHGQAKSKKEDPKRGLTDVGISITEKIFSYAKKLEDFNVSSIYHSPKKRSKDTAKIIADITGIKAISESEYMSPTSDISIWADELEVVDGVLLVGHLPHLDKLASYLTTRDSELSPINIENSAILCLEREAIKKWKVKWYITSSTVI